MDHRGRALQFRRASRIDRRSQGAVPETHASLGALARRDHQGRVPRI